MHTRDAAPHLYYLFYRSPAPFDRLPVHDYCRDARRCSRAAHGGSSREQQRRCARANDSAITLNHVVHHGALGHHVQNDYATRGASRIGQVAAVDGASRIGMFCGGNDGGRVGLLRLRPGRGGRIPHAARRASAQQHTRVRLAGSRGRRSRAALGPAHARRDRRALPRTRA